MIPLGILLADENKFVVIYNFKPNLYILQLTRNLEMTLEQIFQDQEEKGTNLLVYHGTFANVIFTTPTLLFPFVTGLSQNMLICKVMFLLF